MRINRALESLKRLLAARGVTLPASVLVALISTNAIQAVPPALAVAVAATAAATTAMSGSVP